MACWTVIRAYLKQALAQREWAEWRRHDRPTVRRSGLHSLSGLHKKPLTPFTLAAPVVQQPWQLRFTLTAEEKYGARNHHFIVIMFYLLIFFNYYFCFRPNLLPLLLPLSPTPSLKNPQRAMNLGIRWVSRWILQIREKKAVFLGRIWKSLWNGTALTRHCDTVSLQMQPS